MESPICLGYGDGIELALQDIEIRVAVTVGGRTFRTTEKALTEKSLYFDRRFNQDFDYEQGRLGDEKVLFVDRDPDMFGHILRYLHTGVPPTFSHVVSKQHDIPAYSRLLRDAEYYEIPDLVQWIRSGNFLRAAAAHRSSRPVEVFEGQLVSTGFSKSRMR